MKIDPSNITSLKQTKAYELAKTVMTRVDAVAHSVQSLDETALDQARGTDSVSVSHFLVPTGSHSNQVFKAGLSRNTETFKSFAAERAERADAFRVLGEKLERRETPSYTSYEQTVTEPRSGPNTVKVRVDKLDGTIDVKGFYLGFLPGFLS